MGPPGSVQDRLSRARQLFTCSALGLAVWGASGSLPCPATAQTISGTLMDLHTDQPIPLGLVMMFTESGDSVTATITNESGHFSISSPTPGSFLLRAVALGYRETPVGIFDLGEDGVLSVQYRLAPQPLPIDRLVVSLNRPMMSHSLVRNGFVRRLQRGFGKFITPHDIEESVATSTEQLLDGLPGVRVGPVVTTPRDGIRPGIVPEFHPRPDIGETVQIRSPGGGWCPPMIYVDGMRVHYDPGAGFTLSNMAHLGAVEGIEVYRRPAEIPVEYSSGPESNCGVLVVWTKSGLAAGQRPSNLGRRSVAGAEAARLPSVSEQGPPPASGESIRMELDSQVAKTLGLMSPWEGTFVMVREDNLIARDPLYERAMVLPVDGVQALQVLRERGSGHAYVRGAIAGTAVGAGLWGTLNILCRSACDSGWKSAGVPAVLTGLLLGFMVKAQGPGSHWVSAAVPEPELQPCPGGVALSWRLRLRSP